MLNPAVFQQMMSNAQMMQQFQQQYQQFGQQFSALPNQMSPQQIVQQKLANGEMTQEQFNQIRMMANAISGMNY
jgi:hypothetical protein